MKIIFFGTPDYVLPVLEGLHKKFRSDKLRSPIVGVVTQAPKPSGRKKIMTYSAVDRWAHQRQIPIYYQSIDLLTKGVRADIGILCAYGAIIPDPVIALFPQGILNIHPSALPKLRGASPVQATILEGLKEAGVSVIRLDGQMDHGKIVNQFTEVVKPGDTTDSLRTRLFDRSVEVLLELLEPYVRGKIHLKEQDESEATFTTLIKKEDGFIPPEYLKAAIAGKSLKEKWAIRFIKDCTIVPSALNLERFIRAMNAWPCAWSTISLAGREARIKLISAYLEEGKLVPDTVQLEGKEEVSWEEFKRGYPSASF
jgi:methionyl-tRNA formyltransferase